MCFSFLFFCSIESKVEKTNREITCVKHKAKPKAIDKKEKKSKNQKTVFKIQ
jgi:hypothetical protein